MSDRPLVNVGDIVNAEGEDYYRGTGADRRPGVGDLHLRITQVPTDTDDNREWVLVRGIEKPLGKPEHPEADYVIRRRVLLDIERPAPKGPIW
ncbi:hypothetical protein BDK92_5923 [Micromonospora pisi]|uniref:Uncharacterized protein n=1 Tax=Micromonospora pisi TaxID=589240 RepID=A0A495JSD9_9ACTN|nr:hypothetical protein [Micromonospora pisi]RKR91525.1 hypothetical protein BDK92_5923 [Micromonospora pisi]